MIHILLSILSYDIWFYISHVLLHAPPFYTYHKQHHRAIKPIFTDVYDASLVENVAQGIGMFFPYVIVRYTVVDTVIILCILNIRGLLRHDERGVALVGNHHLLHHLEPSYNYGEPWIDSLFNTSHPDKSKVKHGLLSREVAKLTEGRELTEGRKLTTASHNVSYAHPHNIPLA